MSRRVVLDFVGLNSLVTSSLDLTTNVISVVTVEDQLLFHFV